MARSRKSGPSIEPDNEAVESVEADEVVFDDFDAGDSDDSADLTVEQNDNDVVGDASALDSEAAVGSDAGPAEEQRVQQLVDARDLEGLIARAVANLAQPNPTGADYGPGQEHTQKAVVSAAPSPRPDYINGVPASDEQRCQEIANHIAADGRPLKVVLRERGELFCE